MSKPKIKTYRCLHSSDFDKLVRLTYPGIQYEFVADEEGHNYTYVAFDNMTAGTEIDDYDAGKLERAKVDPKHCGYMARVLLQDMVNNGVTPPGNYLIEIYW